MKDNEIINEALFWADKKCVELARHYFELYLADIKSEKDWSNVVGFIEKVKDFRELRTKLKKR